MPPRFFAAPPPPSRARRRLSLALGGALMVAWLVALAVIVRLHLPPLLAKAAIGLAAGLWAAHVVQVMLYNRALDHGRA